MLFWWAKKSKENILKVLASLLHLYSWIQDTFCMTRLDTYVPVWCVSAIHTFEAHIGQNAPFLTHKKAQKINFFGRENLKNV